MHKTYNSNSNLTDCASKPSTLLSKSFFDIIKVVFDAGLLHYSFLWEPIPYFLYIYIYIYIYFFFTLKSEMMIRYNNVSIRTTCIL